MSDTRDAGYLTVMYCDAASNHFLELGGAAFATTAALEKDWRRIPAAPVETDFVLDREDSSADVVDDKFITKEAVEMLLGAPTERLIERARELLKAREES